MIDDPLQGWRVRYVHDGLALAPADPWCHVRIRERVPQRPTSAIVRELREQLGTTGVVEISPVDRITTVEGEFAMLVSSRVRSTSEQRLHVTSVVWGDHTCSRIDGLTSVPSRFDDLASAMYRLTSEHVLGLGEKRRRRFEYTPPSRWRPYPRGLITEWRAPEFPLDHGFISVFPARPVAKTTLALELDRSLHEMSWFGYQREDLATPEPLELMGFDGWLWTQFGKFAEGRRLRTDIAVLTDARFSYVLRLECPPENTIHPKVFRDLVASVRPLPTPRIDVPTFEYFAT